MLTVTNYGPVRELRLNRPPVNALSAELISELRKAIEQAPVDGARAVVVSGPPGMFSAGLDVPLLFKCNRDEMVQLWRELYGLMKALASSSIPICAAITGHAPAGGTVIALFCDWRVAAQGDFKLGLSEVQVGIPLPPVILSALRRQVGARKAERDDVSVVKRSDNGPGIVLAHIRWEMTGHEPPPGIDQRPPFFNQDACDDPVPDLRKMAAALVCEHLARRYAPAALKLAVCVLDALCPPRAPF
jgi:enoyl-CoA hydratase/carnithine racemase